MLIKLKFLTKELKQEHIKNIDFLNPQHFWKIDRYLSDKGGIKDLFNK